MKRTLWVSFFLLMTILAHVKAGAVTYYIDYELGADSNDGTPVSAPWKHHPFMAGWTGGSKYVHSPGDRFIFKGGVTWRADAFPLTLDVGGEAGNQDYYGVDENWYGGDAWTRPIFDGEGRMGVLIAIGSGSHIVLDGIEGRDVLFDAAWGPGIISIGEGPRDIRISNCYLHKWTLLDSLTNDDAHGGVIVNTRNVPEGIVIDSCTISNAEYSSVKNNGVGVLNVRAVRNSTIHDVPTAILFAGEVDGNHIYNINYPVPSFDSSYHTNVIYMAAQSSISGYQYVSNNVIHDIGAGTGIYMEPCFGDTGKGYSTQFVFNNIVYNSYNGGGGIILADPEGGEGPCGEVYIYQNTLQTHDASQIGMVRTLENHAGINQIDVLVSRNNHYIGPSGEWDLALARRPSSRSNLLMSNETAAASGYGVANCFKPSTATSETVDQGSPIACGACRGVERAISGFKRGTGNGWDIGAHEWSDVVAADDSIPFEADARCRQEGPCGEQGRE